MESSPSTGHPRRGVDKRFAQLGQEESFERIPSPEAVRRWLDLYSTEPCLGLCVDVCPELVRLPKTVGSARRWVPGSLGVNWAIHIALGCRLSQEDFRVMRLIVAACAFALLISVSGCGGSAEALTKKRISLLNELADAVDKKDEEKAKSIVKDLNENGEKLKEVSEEEKKHLAEKYKDDISKASKKLSAAVMKDPEFMKKIDFSPPSK
jgi:hypothetical protein